MTDGWVLGRVFLILESGLCKDGERNSKAGGESCGAGWEASHTSLQLRQRLQVPRFPRTTVRREESAPHTPGWEEEPPKGGWLPGGSDAGLAHLKRGKERQAGARHHPVTKSESWKHLSISRKLEKALEIFSSEYLALRCSFSGVFPIL